MKYIMGRVSEPSTHAALAAGFGVLCAVFPQYAEVLRIAVGAFVGIAAALPEGK